MPKIDKKGTRGSAIESGFVGFRVARRPVWWVKWIGWALPKTVVVLQISKKGNSGRIGCPVGQLLSHNVDRLAFAREGDSTFFRIEKFYRLSNGEGRMEC